MNRTKLISTLLFAIMVVGTVELRAQSNREQNDREPHSAVHFSFFPPLSTNGRHSAQYTNGFSFSLLAGVSKNEQAFAFAGLTNVVLNDASGVQFAGTVNYSGGKARGLQFAGLTNYVGDAGYGLQFAGLNNIVRRDFGGVQFAGLFNVAGDFAGLQFGGLFNVAKDVRGFQFAGLFNKARNVRGIQFAALVNIADHSDCPIGLINIIKDGEIGIAAGYNELGTVSLTLRSGGRVMYGIIGAGYNHKVGKSRDAMTLVAGYGAHINILPWLRINNELTIESIDIISSENSTFKTGYALLPAFRLGHFEIFGGPNINFMQTDNPEMYGIFPKNPLWKKERTSGRLQQVYIGWQVGVQFIF